jgi:hypothetical protein
MYKITYYPTKVKIIKDLRRQIKEIHDNNKDYPMFLLLKSIISIEKLNKFKSKEINDDEVLEMYPFFNKKNAKKFNVELLKTRYTKKHYDNCYKFLTWCVTQAQMEPFRTPLTKKQQLKVLNATLEALRADMKYEWGEMADDILKTFIIDELTEIYPYVPILFTSELKNLIPLLDLECLEEMILDAKYSPVLEEYMPDREREITFINDLIRKVKNKK